jgi:hypothetical protein
MNDTDEIIDVTDEVKKEIVQGDIICAHRKGTNALILSRIEPFKRFDGKMAWFKLEHRWFKSESSDVHAVQGNDFIYLTRKEMPPILQALAVQNKTLFDFFDCCG